MKFYDKKIDKRSKLALKNIGASFITKGISILISFFSVSITLDYLNSYEYGIWLTLNSILTWISLADIGLGHGLRNKLTEAIANNDINVAKGLVSTGYFSLSIIIACIYLIFTIISFSINWYSILNVNQEIVQNLDKIVYVCFSFVCIGFVLRLLSSIYYALQTPALNDVLNLISNTISFLLIYILVKGNIEGGLLAVAMIFSGVPILVFLISSIITFSKKKDISPSPRYINKCHIKSIYSLGLKFFILQVTSIIIFSTSNLIISHLFGPQDVTPYNIAYKYVSVLTIGFTIVITPYWSAATDALTRGDYDWVKKSIKLLNRIWLVSLIASFILICLSPWFYSIWIGNQLHVSLKLTIICTIYACVSNWNNIYAYLLAGTGKLLIQLILAISQGIIFIPIALIMGKSLGLIGIPLSLTLVLLLSSIIPPIQLHKLLNNKAYGIWAK